MNLNVDRMLPRHALQTAQELAKSAPVVLLEGPRAVGKSNILTFVIELLDF